MDVISIFRLLNKNYGILLFSSVLFAALTYFYTASLPEEYRSESIMYTGIESGVGNMIDGGLGFMSTMVDNQYANLVTEIEAKSTLDETGMRLLALHLVKAETTPSLMSPESHALLKEWLPSQDRKALTVEQDLEATYQKIKQFYKETRGGQKNKNIFENSGSPYSHKAIEKVNVIRMTTSDFIRTEFTWTDPGITQSTLDILNEVVVSRMSELREGRSNDVVTYFRQRVQEALDELKLAEQKLQQFKMENDVINYDHQARSVAVHNDNMENDYLNEISNNHSLKKSLEKLEEQLEVNKKIFKSSEDILAVRSELAKIQAKIAELDIYYRDDEAKLQLNRKKEELDAQLKKMVSDRWSYGRTTEGIGIDEVLNEWLKHSLALEESDSRMKDYTKRKEYYQQEFDRLTALGTEIEKQTRNIKIKEANYLEMLDALNSALINQKSENMAMTNWVVTLEPTFPQEPVQSKKLMLVFVAFFAGFFVPLGVIILFDYLDQSLRTPDRSISLTGLNLLGAYPNMEDHVQADKEGVDLKNISELSVGLLCQNLLLEARKAEWSAGKTLLISVLSTEPREGKARVTHKMSNELAMRGFNILSVNYKEFEADGNFQYDRTTYEVDKNYLNANAPEQMLPLKKI